MFEEAIQKVFRGSKPQIRLFKHFTMQPVKRLGN